MLFNSRSDITGSSVLYIRSTGSTSPGAYQMKTMWVKLL